MTKNSREAGFINRNRPKSAFPVRPILFVFFVLLVPAAYALKYFSTFHPEKVENYYSLGVYRTISSAVSSYFRLFPFSCAEIMLYELIILAVFLIAVIIKRLVVGDRRAALRIAAFMLFVLSSMYFLFTVMWGLNYNRLPLEESLHYKTGKPTASELTDALLKETDAINSLCDKVNYDSNGHSYYPGGFKKISANVNDAYLALQKSGENYRKLFSGAIPRPKGILASKLLSYTGIEGIFIPFTCEPNVDTDLPAFVLPFDAAHESAHLKGFAREQEANFVAYLAGISSPDPYFQYSAHMEAYIYLSNALFETDIETLKKVAPLIDKRAVSDFEYYSNYVTAHESTASEISNKVNDTYLKSQGQQGVITYNMFVTLLIEKYRTEK